MTSASPSGNSAISNLLNSVGNYNGYENQAQRQNSDKNIRNYMISKIKALLAALDSVPGATDEKDQERLDDLTTKAKRKLTTVCESLKRPTYEGSVFFSKGTLREKMLARLYDFENMMLGELDGLDEEISAMKTLMERKVFEENFLHIMDFVDNLNQSLFEREAAILEVEQ
ncbi:hypothetical protein JW935_22075 [candidate division KSB1 bacterium]|nr:hypothetical protein [candidate division KSB1 bacterium]